MRHRHTDPAERAWNVAEHDSRGCEVDEWPRLPLRLYEEYVREFAAPAEIPATP